ncbi:hypothetical protein PHYBOEH_001989 [Phytophthora boehmeriae]|uniref:Outer arm dynein light chain 1 n=1 Tax=Phytophthora boehmeriae TaxID=109152 RepID=A0A8T1WSZ1_9STRA|nr:hypothetical protein PHYBOEH_001989 [Phytophthora boehmeriae]
MENLNELTELRVLNLGGNVICTLENIDKLTLLTELNLRRNQISRIGTIGKLPSLLRLFLSNNKLESFESLEPLFQVSSLNELRLDSNGVSGSNQSSYRSRMIRVFPVLKHLDLKPLSEIDRKEALLRLSPAKASSDDDDAEAAARARAISSAKAAWERRSNPLLPAMVKNDSPDTPSFTSWGTFDKQGSMSHAGYEERESTPTGREESTEHNDGAGFSEIELYGDYRVLVIHGNALEVLETTRANTLINAISFRFVGISEIIAAVTNAVNANLKVFTRLRRLIFAHNDLQSFDDLLWLSSLGPRAEEVFISHNPVCGKNLLRRYIGARLSNTLRFNGDEITIIDRQLGRQLFPKPSIPRSRLLDSSELSALLPSKPRGKEMKLTGSAVALDSNTAVSEIFCTASDIDQKNAALDQAWRGMLLSIVKETLQDIERRDNFMSGCLDNL